MTGKVLLHLDDIIFSLQRFGGISTYWSNLTKELESRAGFEIVRTFGSAMSRLLTVESHARVFHSSYFRLPSSNAARCVVTVHDLSFEKGIVRPATRLVSIYQRRKAIKRADAIVCISENTRRDLFEVYPHTRDHPLVRVIYHGCGTASERSLRSREQAAPSTAGSDPPFAMFVGPRPGYKNFLAALEGFARSQLKTSGQLVCTGEPLSSAEKERIRKLKLQRQVVVIANASTEVLHDLYHRATVLLYPSSHEGFGFPIVEAMAFGCPVIACSASAVPEVAGRAALLLEKVNAETISEAINRTLIPSVRAELVRLGRENVERFSWTASATAHAELYSAVASA